MSEPVEGTLTAGEVTAIEMAGPVFGVVVTATDAEIWVSTDGGTPFVDNPNTAQRVPAGTTRTIDVVGPTNPDTPTIVKLVSDEAAGYTVTAGRRAAADFEEHDRHDHTGVPGVGGGDGDGPALPDIGEGDAGKAVVVTAEEDGFELAQSGAPVAADVDFIPAGALAATDVQAALEELDTDKASSTVTANRQTASYTLVLADAGKVVEMNVADANNLTVPPNASVAFPAGTVIELFQYGAGQTTVVADTGVTIRSSDGKLKLGAQYAAASLRKIATDEWALQGEISA